MHPKEAMETREHSPDCVRYCSQTPTAREDILKPAMLTIDSSSCRACTNSARRPPPCLSESLHAHKNQAHPSVLSNCFNLDMKTGQSHSGCAQTRCPQATL